MRAKRASKDALRFVQPASTAPPCLTPLVIFTPSGKRGRIAEGTTLLDAARKLGVDLDSVCAGRGICGRCQIGVAEGDFPKHGIASRADHLTPWNEVEARYAAIRGSLRAGRRLGCQAHVAGDVVIDVPPESQVHRQVVRKDADTRPILLDPVVHLRYVEVAEPDMHDPSGDFRRLAAALEKEWQIAGATASLPVLATLQKALRAGQWKVTAAIRENREVVAVWPDLVDRCYGVAVDIGSTTIAAHLSDLVSGETLASAGVMNPQIRFGEDLMSRVSYVMMHPGGDREMTAAVREAVDTLIGSVAAQANIPRDRIVEMTAVGNPIMHHLFLGLDPVELGGAPFALTVDSALDTPAADLGLTIAPGARVHTLPLIAGHVGADCAGVVLAEAPYAEDKITLLVDIGTNAEIVLGNRTTARLLLAHRPRLRGRANFLRPARRPRRHRAPAHRPGDPRAPLQGHWFRPLVRRSGVRARRHRNRRHRHLRLRHHRGDRRNVPRRPHHPRRRHRRHACLTNSAALVADGRTFTYVIREGEPRIAVTQSDVRAIQLAKAALYAGVRLLMDHYGTDHVEKIGLAGAFGSHIDVNR